MAPKQADRSVNHLKQNEWVFLMPNNAITAEHADICQLRHPKTQEPCMVLFSDHCVYEINQFKANCRSWFVDKTVQQGGDIHICTPIDPLLLILPYVVQAREQKSFSPLDHIIQDEKFPDCDRLALTGVRLDGICDSKGSDDCTDTVIRYNEDKTLAWLKTKVERTAEILKEKNVHVGPGFAVDTYVLSKKERVADICYTKYAFELVSDYLCSDLGSKLADELDIKGLSVQRQELSSSVDVPPKKKIKLEGPTEDYSTILKPMKLKQNLTTTQKKLEKLDKTGMKSITNFFTVKAKK